MQAGYFREEVKIVSRGNNQNVIRKAAYDAGVRLVDTRDGKVYDFSNKRDVYSTEILAPANAPDWMLDRSKLWNGVEQTEDKSRRREDAQLAREVILCFPACLSHDEKIAAAREYVQSEFVWKGMVADVAYHFNGKTAHNPHVHVLLTMRDIDGKGFGKKNRSWNNPAEWKDRGENIEGWRKRWADTLNKHLERGGYDVRVDHRGNLAQNTDRLPQVHEGANVTNLRRRHAQNPDKYQQNFDNNQVIQHNEDIKHRNAEREELKQTIKALQSELRHEHIKQAHYEQRREERILKRQMLSAEKTTEQDNSPYTLDRTRTYETATSVATTLTRQLPASEFHQRANALVTSTMQHDSSSTQNPSAIQIRKDDPPGWKPRRREPNEPTDWTWRLVREQLEAMGGDGNFEIGILDRASEKMQNKTWHKHDILRVDPETKRTPILNYLKYENSQGKDIFIRLAPTKDSKQQGLVLIDDIDPVTVEDLKDKGLAPAVVIETSYKNCQAWIRASKEPIERETATHLAKLLTREAGGDPGSASYQHYGRLAGFTNRKPDHQDMYTGRHPYVKLLSAYGTTAPEGEQWLAQAQSAAAIAREKQQEAAALRDQRGNREATEQEKEKALRAFESSYAHALRHYGTNKDYSARDWALTKNLAKLGYSQDALQYALRWGSPDLEKRKPGHEDDYVARTVAKVFEHPEVLQAIAEREARRKKREQENQRQQPLPLTQPTEKQNPTEPPFPSPTPTPSSSQAKEQTAVPEQSLTEDERQLIEAMKWLNDGKERGKQERRPEHHLPVRPPANDKQSYADRAEPATPMPDTGEKVSLDAEAEIVNTFPTPASSDQNPSSKGSAKVPVYWNSYYRWLQTQQIVRQPKPARIDPGTASAKRPPVPIKAEPVGDLDADSVAAIINAAHQSKNATQQLRTASWAYQNFNQDEGRWNKCKLEYFRELHRVHQAFGRDEALNPKTDIEIALKLRMAGFSVTQIYRTIQEASPVATSLPSQEHQFVYLKKAIQPYLQSSQTRTVANNFQYERERQAKRTITDPTQLQNHLAERRLEKLGLATPVSTQTQNPTPQQTRSPQPQPNHRPSPLPQHKRDDCEPER